ncbi:hypothetical protein GCM10010112_23310 [Actinoplanes lobatus]|uniref:Uncharacterized protein n=1 Tax=Actinoplanes lobatus TaxID=113568 RepID=A0A7W7HIX2_9ACTN|nr:hypothetical protein [Actinoplanes lobatus]GGN63762.1 hypothetical protein GCM10010112_23310 [Actinoplanes lobatus]
MSIAGPLIALAGVVVGVLLSYAFALLREGRRERWALNREWREHRLQIYSAYVIDAPPFSVPRCSDASSARDPHRLSRMP